MFSRTLLLALAGCAALLAASAPARADVVDDEPAVAARGAGDMRAVIRGSDGVLWARAWDGAGWSGWSSLGGGQLTSGPAISARPDGVYDVVARGTDSAYYHRAFTPAGGWTPWDSLGGAFLSAPSVSYRQGTGQIDIGPPRRRVHVGPGATSVGPNRLHVFARDQQRVAGQLLLEHLD